MYRSELTGMLDKTKEMRTVHSITARILLIGCDEIGALKSIQNAVIDFVYPKQTHSVISSAESKLRNIIPIELEFVHTRCHQDDEEDYGNDRLVQLNVAMVQCLCRDY